MAEAMSQASNVTGSQLAQAKSPVDEILPARELIPFGVQHVLVMAASPITSVFLISKALNLSPALSINLISATFLVCGIGTLLQSFGPWKFGARLPFIMVPGGAPIVIFLTIAKQTNLQTATGAVIITGIFYFVILPVFARCLKFFPRLVIGTMLLLVAINLVKIYGSIVTGNPGSVASANRLNIYLALATIGFTVLFARLLKGTFGQLSVLLGLLAGAIAAAAVGAMHLNGVLAGPMISAPTPLPFGLPAFNIVAAVPLMIFSVISMAEATGQTVAISEIAQKPGDPYKSVPRTIRGDALISLLGGLLGTSLIITSGENIGVVRATGVRSRYVTATSGVILVLLALFAPLGRLVNAIPASVVGGTAIIVFCIIGAIGIDMLRKVDLSEHGNVFILAAALAMGLLPILIPGLYASFSANAQIILGNGLAMGTLTAVALNILFHHVGRQPKPATDTAGFVA